MTDTSPDRSGTIVGGRYRLEEQIAQSLQLQTYRARHLELDQHVAVQLLRAPERRDSNWLRRFRSEVRVLSKLRHPNVVEIHDFGQMHDGAPYLVVEYLEGRPISWVLRDDGPLPPDRVVEIVRDVARGLRYAHQFGVYHLAIMPANVVLVDQFDAQNVKIVDFLSGRWHRIDPSASAVPDWRVAAPELIRGDDPTPATDLYSVGHFARACLTGRLLLHDADEERCRQVHLSQDRWELFPEGLEVPDQLGAIIERCLARQPRDRFTSCAELIDMLEQFENSAAETVRLPSVDKPGQRGFFPAKGDMFAGKFSVEQMIGRGGFSRVFKATVEGGRPVALKILRPDRKADVKSVRRFIREGKLIFTLLSNPHTISVFDYGETEEGLLYIAFEYIDGMTLDQLLVGESTLAPDRVIRILEQCLSSLAEAHGMGVLHRDIKPSNVMLSLRNGVEDWVTVLDFGVAKITSGVVDTTDITATGAALGTPRYMSPEQISGEALGPESDLYSLGLVAYELLVGEKAIGGETTLEIITNQLDPQSVILPARAGVPAPLALIVNRMMRKDRHTRYQSAGDVLVEFRDLDREVGDATIDTGTR